MENPNKGRKMSSSNSNRKLPTIKIHLPTSPHHSTSAASSPSPVAGARRKIGVAVDLSEESAYAVRWAVQNYLRPGDAVILLHVSPTNVLYGADWGPLSQAQQSPRTPETQKQLEDDFDAFTASKAADLAKPLCGVTFNLHTSRMFDLLELMPSKSGNCSFIPSIADSKEDYESLRISSDEGFS
ncbi:hypothetical protein GOBAR_DD14942 [Gossypium barbadense]|nr:hypothetical protein GOBAR_DD14942 [Gossypium barbadense]